MTKENSDRDSSIELLKKKIIVLTGQIDIRDEHIGQLEQELGNFIDMHRKLEGKMPDLNGFDIYGQSISLSGVVGGDHLIYVDFNKRYELYKLIQQAEESGRQSIVEKLELNKKRAGILLVDASGHRITDAAVTQRLHDAFFLGALYELQHFGEITTNLFEKLNTRLHNSLSDQKYLTFVYGEISESGKFRYILGGHPPPVIFSSERDIIQFDPGGVETFPPLGMIPSEDHVYRGLHFSPLGYKERYVVNEIGLERGDILLLYSDGLAEHSNGSEDYFPARLEQRLREEKHLPARDIFASVKRDILDFARPADDISYVVIKKN